MAHKILPRSTWTPTPEGFSHPLVTSRVTWAAFHYPGDGNHTYASLTQAQACAKFRAYRSYHVNSRGWADIGYCYGIDQSGRIYSLAGRKVAAHSASAAYPGANHDGIGILLLIGNNEAPSAAMIAAANWLLRKLRDWYPNLGKVYGHRQVRGASTSCPGDKTIALINAGTIGLSGAVSPPKGTGKPAPSKPAAKPSKGNAKHRAWQERQNRYGDAGLYVDGVNGPVSKNWKAWTKKLQRALPAWKGIGKLRVDGDYGPLTNGAVKMLQSRNGLYVDGFAQSKTLAFMRRHGSDVPNRPSNRP